MNRYYLIKADSKTDLDKIFSNVTTLKHLKIESVEITKEINENGLTQSGFLTEIIDNFKGE